jgi:hypothetical protein
MGTAINLDTSLVKEARIHSKILHRSVPKQIEHWARIGCIVEDNPDLSYTQIKDILLGLQDHAAGNVKEYKRGIL